MFILYHTYAKKSRNDASKKQDFRSRFLCWWSAGDSNSSPRQCECRALPDELAPHFFIIPYFICLEQEILTLML